MILCARFPRFGRRSAALSSLVALAEGLTPGRPGAAARRAARRSARRRTVLRAGRARGSPPSCGSARSPTSGLGCAIGLAPNPMLARMAARDAGAGTTRVVGAPTRWTGSSRTGRSRAGRGRRARPLAPSARTDSTRGAPRRRSAVHRSADRRRQGGTRTPGTGPRRRPHPGRPERRSQFPRGRTHLLPRRVGPVDHRRALLSLAEEMGARLRGADQVCRSLTPHRALRRPVHDHPHPRACANRPRTRPRSPTPAYGLYAVARPATGAGAGRRAAGRGADAGRTRRPAADVRPGGRPGSPHRGGGGPGPRALRPAGDRPGDAVGRGLSEAGGVSGSQSFPGVRDLGAGVDRRDPPPGVAPGGVGVDQGAAAAGRDPASDRRPWERSWWLRFDAADDVVTSSPTRTWMRGAR